MATAARDEARRLMTPLLAANFVFYLVLLGLAAWSLDKYLDGHQDHPHLGGNPSTIFLIIYALMAGMIVACSVFLGFLHLHVWNNLTLCLPRISSSSCLEQSHPRCCHHNSRCFMGHHCPRRRVYIHKIEKYIQMHIPFTSSYYFACQNRLVWKHIALGGHRGKRLQTLEAFITISGLSQLLYLLLLNAGMISRRYGPDYNT